MTEGLGAKDAPHAMSDEDRAQEQDPFRGMGELERRASLAWVGENLTEVRRAAFGQRILYWSLGIGFMVGLAADVGGYLIKSSTTTGSLFGLAGDLLYTFGWALWTGVVVVVFLQIIPEAKRRQYKGGARCLLPRGGGSPKRRSIARLTAEVPTKQPRSERSGVCGLCVRRLAVPAVLQLDDPAAGGGA